MAIVSKRSSLAGRGIGVDVEQRGRVREAVFGKLFTEDELEVLADLDDDQRARNATIGFSAKEAFYKAQYPITGAWVSFTDVSVEITPGGAKAHRATDLAALDEVCWPIDLHVDVRDTLVVTGAVVAPTSSGGAS